MAFYACLKPDNLSGETPQLVDSTQSIHAPTFSFNDFKKIGKQHNEGLDFIYEKIKAGRIAGKTPQQIVGGNFVIQSVIEFLASDTVLKSFVPELLKDTASLKVTIDKVVYTNLKKLIREAETLSALQKDYALRILAIDADNPKEFETALMPIVHEIEEVSLSNKEKYPLLAMAGVALYSFDYWFLNTQKWDRVLSVNTNLFVPVGFSWGNFWDKDATGALFGGLGRFGAMLVFGGPATWSVMGGGILAGAITSSGKYAWDQR